MTIETTKESIIDTNQLGKSKKILRKTRTMKDAAQINSGIRRILKTLQNRKKWVTENAITRPTCQIRIPK